MNNIVLDVTNKKGITAVVISYKGQVSEMKVYRSKFENQYENLIDGYILGAKMLHDPLAKYLDFDGDLLVVSNNSALITWLEQNYTLPKYSEQFKMLLRALEALPAKIEFIKSSDLVSDKFATKSNIEVEKLSSIASVFD